MNFTRNGLRLGSSHQEPPHTDSVKEFGYSCSSEASYLAKEKKNLTVAQWFKVLFSDESKFCISFGNQGPRVWRKGGEAHSLSCLKCSVRFLIVKRIMRNKRPKKKADELKATVKKNLGFPYHLSSATN